MTKQALIELRDKVASGNLNSTELSSLHGCMSLKGYWIHSLGFNREQKRQIFLAYGCSIDAAVSFLKSVLPDWAYSIYVDKLKPAEAWIANPEEDTEYAECVDLIPARALLLATLEALIERVE